MDSITNKSITPAMRAEASAWIARLHGPKRDARVEAGLRAWLAAHPAHPKAFEQVTGAWDAVGSVPSETLSSKVRWEQLAARRTNPRTRMISVAAVLAMLVVGALYSYLTMPLTTGVGEQRMVTLEDGTRVHMNTATRVRVRFDEHTRRIELDSGEALFEVAKQASRPFIVFAGDQEITALGTSFVVRRDSDRLAVTLMEGKVTVQPVAAAREADANVFARASVLSPGQRLTVTPNSTPQVDEPPLERVAAWRRGLVIFDGARLADAVEEMNRYSSVALSISSERATEIRVSGAFRAGDSLSFAEAIAATYRLEVSDERDRIVLSGEPATAYR